jgi:hypothetical protein
MHKTRIAGLTLMASAGAAGVAVAIASCAATTTNQAVRTFQQAQKVDVVCLHVNDVNGNPLPSVQPVAQNECAPVPPNTNGAPLPNHLCALVTQTTRGELAVVDLTSGNVVDQDRSTPGINFIPVGSNPTDVAVAPDAKLTFVSSADPNKPAIYAIDNARILGDSTGLTDGGGRPPPLRLTDLSACALPQAPQALAIAPLTGGADGGDAGDGGNGDEGGAAPLPKYAIIALLRGSADASAKVVALDPAPFTQGAAPFQACVPLGAIALSPALPSNWTAGPAWPDGVPYADAGDLSATEPVCPSSSASVADGGAEAGDDGGDASSDDAAAAGDAVATAAGSPDGGDAGFALSLGPQDLPHPSSMALRDDVPVLYVADDALPVIHVIDLSDPRTPLELPPLLATSLDAPTRRVSVRGLAVSPPTRDYRRYLYAIDSEAGTLMVYDVTVAKPSAPATPLVRPHDELNPFAPPDRISFSAPVATVAFVQHDWPLLLPGDPTHAYQGLLCNPNPNAHPSATEYDDLGAYYRASQVTTIQPQGGTVQGLPYRLRGIFAFATLSNGNIVTIDVDDWDAPCRRPDPMAITSDVNSNGVAFGMTGALDLPEQDAGYSDADPLDPYLAPYSFEKFSGSAAVTQEAFFPVSAPNRMRSNFLLRNDPTTGQHVPTLLGNAQLFDVNGAPVAASGTGGTRPLILPTPLPDGFIDPSYIQNPTAPDPGTYTTSSQALESAVGQVKGVRAPPDAEALDGGAPLAALLPGSSATTSPAVRVSFDDPTVHADQDWTVSYEGVLPNTSGLVADMASTDPAGSYNSLTLTTKGGRFCDRGIEDWSIGQTRAKQVVSAMGDAGFSTTVVNARSDLPRWTADYIEITDDMLAPTDAYWSTPTFAPDGEPLNDCWDAPLADDPKQAVLVSPHAQDRYVACQEQFGAATDADTHLARDFPILQAFDDHLVVGRFGFSSMVEQTTSRLVVRAHPTNAPFLRLATCCFHHQAAFKVRAGGEWVTVGQNGVGFLNRIVTDPSTKACVMSCDPRKALLNARAFDVPWSDSLRTAGDGGLPLKDMCVPPTLTPGALDRNSPLAMRNPFFSFVMWSGCPADGANGEQASHTTSTRDLTWKFSMRGGFSPLAISLNGNTGAAVIPQSMRFIASLGQLAVVDGAQQGLVLIDLNNVNFAHNPYF